MCSSLEFGRGEGFRLLRHGGVKLLVMRFVFLDLVMTRAGFSEYAVQVQVQAQSEGLELEVSPLAGLAC